MGLNQPIVSHVAKSRLSEREGSTRPGARRVGAVAGIVGAADGEGQALAQLAALRGTVGSVPIGQGGGEPQPLPPGILRLRPDGRYEALMNGQALPPGAVRLTTV